jgi:large subunit ribosomal protein L16
VDHRGANRGLAYDDCANDPTRCTRLDPPAEARMGKGKGPVDHWVAVVRPGTILFEISGLEEAQAKRVHELVSHKLPIRTKLKKRIVLGGEV